MPDPVDQGVTTSGRRKKSRRRFTIVTAITVAVLVAGGATAYAVSTSGNSGYRTATVVRASIANSQDLIGTVEPVNEASASFQVAGQVATIDATVGQQVTAGQVLGTLDTTSLSESLSSAQSSLASDEAQLTEDEDSEAASTTTTTSTTTPSTTGGGSAATGGSGDKSGGSGTGTNQISQDQATLVADQAKASAGQQQEAADLTQALKTCIASSSTPTSTTSSNATSNPGFTPPSSTTTTTTTPTTTPTTGANACGTAIELVSSDQQAVAADQATVATDESALAKALTAEESSSGSPTSSGSSASSTTTTTPSKTSTGTSNLSGGGSGGSAESARSGASSPSDSAATIASDEATIDTAEANLVDAQQSLSDAQLTTPIAGTIASVGMSVGDTVSADSSTEAIVIIGTQSFEADATLSSTQVSSVKVGDPAEVSVDGTNKPIAGSVSQVGPVQSSDGTYTYPVVVALPSSAAGLFTGSSANISITTSEVKNVLAVPTSAVNTEGTRSFVVELSSGNPVDKAVKVGVVGYTYTQLTSGLTQGDRVVLANYSAAVPSSSASTLGGFGGGGFGGTGRFGGGGGGLGGGGGRFNAGGGATTFGG